MTQPRGDAQEELLRLFFSATSDTSMSSTPPPIVSPYPASSYTKYTHPPAPTLSSSPEQREQKEQLFLSPSSSFPSSLFRSAHPLLSPHQQRRASRAARTKANPFPVSSASWNAPLVPTLHLPIVHPLLSRSSLPLSSASPPPLPPLPSALSTVQLHSPAYERSLRLRTSNDAIAYFSRLGSSSPVKFLYANRSSPSSSSSSQSSTSSTFHPYDLTVVPRKQIDPREYFTISTHGIVQITGSDTECTSLSDWVHQSTTFDLLRAIRFFRHFLAAKLFRLWKANVRYRVFCHQRQRLSSGLFLARPSFCKALMDLKETMSEVSLVPFCAVRPGVVYSGEAFGKEQGEVRASGVKRVEGCIERVEDLLESVCKGVKDRARLYDHRIANEELSNSRFAQHLLGETTLTSSGSTSGKVKSMVRQKEEKRVRLKQLQHANREADMLGDFIRLVDYVEVETLVDKCITTTADLLSLLLSTQKPLFTTSVSFSPDPPLLFTPTAADISGVLTSLSDLTIGSVDSLSRVVGHPKFQLFLRQHEDTGLRVSRVVHGDRGYQVMMAEMDTRIAAGFAGVHDSVRFLEKHRGVWEYGEAVRARLSANLPLLDDDIPSPTNPTPSTIAPSPTGLPTPTPILTLTHTLTGLTRWSTSLQHIRDLYSCGLVQADCRQLKLTLLPITEAAIGRKRRRMVDLFVDGVERVMAAYAHFASLLKDDPVLLSQYVDYVRVVQTVKEQERALRTSMVRELDGLHALMVEHDVYDANWVATSEQVRFDEMRELSATFALSALRDAHAKLDSKWEDMKAKIMGEIKRFESAIDALQRSLDDQALYTDYAQWGGVGVGAGGAKEVLVVLDGEGKKIKEVQKKTEEMQRQQQVLEETPHLFKGLTTLLDKWEKKRAFFVVVENFKEKEKRFWLAELEKVDLSTFGNEVSNLETLVNGYTSGGKGEGKGSERGVGGVMARESEMVRQMRGDLQFYGGFLCVVRDLQKIYVRLGSEGYRQSFLGFGHLKRMKDLRKVDWAQHKAAIQAKLDDFHL